MKKIGKPVDEDFLELHKLIKSTFAKDDIRKIDFADTKNAFAHLSKNELKSAVKLFTFLTSENIFDKNSLFSINGKLSRFSFYKSSTKKGILKHFGSGTTLLNSLPAIDKLSEHNIYSNLNYIPSSKNTYKNFNFTMNEIIRAIDFATTRKSIPFVTIRIPDLIKFNVLESISSEESVSNLKWKEYRNLIKRIDSICHTAAQKKVQLIFEPNKKVQHVIDKIAILMMKRYNKNEVIIYNSFEIGTKMKLNFLFDSFEKSQNEKYLLGVKIKFDSITKKTIENDFDMAIKFCLDNIDQIAMIISCYDEINLQHMLKIIDSKKIKRNNKHINFQQIYGIGDNITYNLVKNGYYVTKCLPYGQNANVLPFNFKTIMYFSDVLEKDMKYMTSETARRNS